MSTTTTASPTEAKLWGGGKSPFSVEYGKVMMWYFLMSDAFTFLDLLWHGSFFYERMA